MTYPTTAREALRSILRHVRENGPWQKTLGICSTVRTGRLHFGYTDFPLDEMLKLLERAFIDFGMHPEYPLSHPHYESNCQAFNDTHDLWDRDTEYGRSRWALLDRLIDYLDPSTPLAPWRTPV